MQCPPQVPTALREPSPAKRNCPHLMLSGTSMWRERSRCATAKNSFCNNCLCGRSGWFPGPFRICLYRVRCLRRLPPGTDAKAPRHSSNPRGLSPFGLAGVGDLGPTKCYPLAGTWQRLSGRNRAARCPTRKACPTTSNASSQIARAASGETRRGILSWMLKKAKAPKRLGGLPGLVHRSQMSLVDHAG